MPQIRSLSLVIPMYNEQDYAVSVIEEAIRVISALPLEFEIIAVDDCSCDDTPLILDTLAGKNKKIKVMRNPCQLGLGGSLRKGFLAASKEVVLYTDADMPCDMREIKTAVALMEENNADIVSAYKANGRNEGFKRWLYSFVYNKMINLLFNLRLRDINFSFKLFARDKLNRLVLESQGSFINAELFVRARRAGYNIIEFPSRYYPRQRGGSKLDNWHNIMQIIHELSGFIIRITSRRLNNPGRND